MCVNDRAIGFKKKIQIVRRLGIHFPFFHHQFNFVRDELDLIINQKHLLVFAHHHHHCRFGRLWFIYEYILRPLQAVSPVAFVCCCHFFPILNEMHS